MKFSERWLREHVSTSATREELSARLTAIGLEVEADETIGTELQSVIVAQIVKAEKHPEADRLQVCEVSIGNKTVQIVCGAPNARAGLKAPLAQVGATLPGGLEIKAAKLRGVESFGMLCSAKELAIDPDASGLLELPDDAPVGAALADYLGLPDARFELKLTPNRADCFSVRGVAFDVAAAFGTQVLPMQIDEVKIESTRNIHIELHADADCPRYCGRFIEGVNPQAKTPLWLSEKLKRAGLRPISPLVDVTNFVMLELGQPMHAFDADTLKGPIGVRRAKSGEVCKLLDEQDAKLTTEFLIITDADEPVAVAGVMGGYDTRVTDKTVNVFLESAHFAPAAIIGRARKLGLHTDASQRFERGVDPELPRLALERASALILQIMGGKASAVIAAQLSEQLTSPKPVQLHAQRLQRVLGISVAANEVEQILRSLGMQVQNTNDGWSVTPSSRRFDIAIEEDLIEEIARIHGYDKIPTRLPAGEIVLSAPSETRVQESILRRQMIARDFSEALNYAFVDAQRLQQWKLSDKQVALANPLTSELGVMRTSLLPGLVDALRANLHRQQQRVRLFEIGRVFHLAPNTGDAPIETQRIAAVVCGNASAEQWGEGKRDVDFYDLKSTIESIAELSNQTLVFKAEAFAYAHPGRSAGVWLNERRIGWLGHLHPRLIKALDLDEEVIGFELDLEHLQQRAVPKAGEISKFPSIRRDLAVIVSESTPWSTLEASLKSALGDLLQHVLLFDRYQGKGLEPATKSLAMGLILQDVSRTLTDQDADKVVQSALAALARDCGAKLR